jgi:hypothetical protein
LVSSAILGDQDGITEIHLDPDSIGPKVGQICIEVFLIDLLRVFQENNVQKLTKVLIVHSFVLFVKFVNFVLVPEPLPVIWNSTNWRAEANVDLTN